MREKAAEATKREDELRKQVMGLNAKVKAKEAEILELGDRNESLQAESESLKKGIT